MMVTNKTLSIIAYFLSEYDMDAVKALGFENRSEAIRSISIAAGKDDNFLKFRRDEFDALPESSSNRNGWRNRPPRKEVKEMAEYLRQFSFDELTDIVRGLIDDLNMNPPEDKGVVRTLTTDSISEEELEQIVNFTDENASVEIVTRSSARRVCNTSIIKKLKKLYNGKCQICGTKPFDIGGEVDICEAHHIEHFSESQNNNASNIIILCPNHHRLIHKLNPAFDRTHMCFRVGDMEIGIKTDFHLMQD